MKNFLNLLAKSITTLIIISAVLYVSWNMVIVPELGIGKKADLYTFFNLSYLFAILIFIFNDNIIVSIMKYIITWTTLIKTAIIFLLAMWIISW